MDVLTQIHGYFFLEFKISLQQAFLRFSLNDVYSFFSPGPVGSTSLLTEEQITTMSPTAAAVSKVKPNMKLTEVCTAVNLLFILVSQHFVKLPTRVSFLARV